MAEPNAPIPKYQPPAQTPQQPDQTQNVSPAQQPVNPPQPQQPAPQQPQVSQQPPPAAPTEQTEWQAAQEEQFVEDQQAPVIQVDPVTWSSTEYIEHEKTPMWYGIFLGATIAITGIIYILTNEVLASVAILVTGASAAFFAGRPAATRQYEITTEYIMVGPKKYDMEGFKSFSIVEEGAKDSVWLHPTKRFAPSLIIYFSQEDEQRIVETLYALLPQEDRQLDSLDRLSKKLRF